MPSPFVHLHNHSEFSLLDGAAKIKDMVAYAVEMGMPALAITDHGMMYGAFEFYQKAKAAGINGIVGCCLPGQRIHTENGVKPIEQIRVGEKVLTHTGEYKPVLRTMTRQYEGTLYGIRAANSHEVWLTDEHPIRVRDGGTGKLRWVRADELRAGRLWAGRRGAANWRTYACLPKIKPTGASTLRLSDFVDKSEFGEVEGWMRQSVVRTNRFQTSLSRPVPDRITLTADLMRVFGLYVAEGSTFGIGAVRHGLCWTFGADEAHFASFVSGAVETAFGIASKIYFRPDKNIIEVRCSNRILATLFEALFGKGARNKRIPGFVYQAETQLKRAFLNGVADGDARHHDSGQIALKMASENVVYGAKLLAASLGWSGGVQHQTTADGRTHYLFAWNPQASFRKYVEDDDNLYLPIKEVLQRSYCGPVYNIEVEGDHSYVTDFALHNCELYVATRGRKDRDPKKDGNHHLVALAKNEAGYKNLMKLATKASLEGFYYKPRVDWELLTEHHEGLIICSACMGGELAKAVVEGKGSLEPAKNVAARFRDLFGDDFYLEVQAHHAEGQWDINEAVKRISRQMNIKMVATNDSHYLKAEDADAHDVLICIQTGTTVQDPKRMKYEPREFYLKSYEEMMGAFENFAPDAIENTLEVAEKCNLEIEVGRVPMPAVDLPGGKTPQEHMTDLCWEGLQRRLPHHADVHKDRLTYELDIIEQTGFSQYFLIVMDISNHARSSGIFFGVRGSAAGSLASYCLGITDLDPIEYNLTFERFLNPERVTMPDIDMDFEDTRRAEVIQHVTEKYGKEQVAFITTFGTLGAKAAIRDAGRALALPVPDVDRLARMVPSLPVGITIQRAMQDNPEFGQEYANNEMARKLVDTAQRLEGISRHASVHAAGIMIADRPLVEYTPLAKTADGSLVTQYPHSSLESIGLLKMDFLGLSNLSILARAVKLIKETRGEDIDVWDLPLDYDKDERVKRSYDMLGRGETTGIFQLESQGMRKYVVDLRPNSVKELAAMVALYRPGPMAHIPRYIRGKFDPTVIEYSHELLKPILEETYGVIVYQDQVLKIVQAIAGFSLGQADLLRRAMGKKKASEMEKQRENFLKGAKEKGVSTKVAEQIFAEIEPFAGYAFNGAHAACYAMVAYQTAYLKANYPAEYLAALMGAYIDNTEKVVATIEECGRLGVKILPPCVNESHADFTVKGDDVIRFGLLAIKNVGRAPIDAILAARQKGGAFASLDDFCTRVFAEGLTSKSVIEMLIKAGALVGIQPNRRALVEGLDDCCTAAARGARDKAAGLSSLFGDSGGPADDANNIGLAANTVRANLADFPRGEVLAMEKELLGLYLSEHPVRHFEPILRRKHRALALSGIKETQNGQQVTVGGMVAAVRTHYTKKGEPMLFVTLEDTSGSVGVTCFPQATSRFASLLIQNAIVIVKGKASHRERIVKGGNGDAENGGAAGSAQVEVLVDEVEQIVANAMAEDARPRAVHICLDESNKTLLRMVRETLVARPGGSPVYLRLSTGRGLEPKVKTPLLVDPDEGLIEQVRRMLGGGQKRVWVE